MPKSINSNPRQIHQLRPTKASKLFQILKQQFFLLNLLNPSHKSPNYSNQRLQLDWKPKARGLIASRLCEKHDHLERATSLFQLLFLPFNRIKLLLTAATGRLAQSAYFFFAVGKCSASLRPWRRKVALAKQCMKGRDYAKRGIFGGFLNGFLFV